MAVRRILAAALSVGLSVVAGGVAAQGGSGLRDEPAAFGLRSGLDTRSLNRAAESGALGVSSAGVVLADWRPLSSGFRITGGFTYNNPGLDAFDSAVRAGAGIGVDLPAAGSGTVRGLGTRSNPYLGLGWGIAPTPRSGLYFSADVGVMYLRSGGGTCSSALPPTLCAQLQNDVRLDDEARDARLSPVLTLGVGLRF